ncbi:MAG TPA: hypothetical protein VGA01_03960, partial [Candidatus Binatia bacterium]
RRVSTATWAGGNNESNGLAFVERLVGGEERRVSVDKNTANHVTKIEVRIFFRIEMLLATLIRPARVRALRILQNGRRYEPGVFYYEICGSQ